MTEQPWDPRKIAQEAKRAAIAAHLPYEQGQRVAWTLGGFAGHTDGLSEVHIAYDSTTTYCEEPLPDPIVRFPTLASLYDCFTCAERMRHGWTKTVELEATNDSELTRSVA